MRYTILLLLVAVGCSTPPRYDNPTEPVAAFYSFRGALARNEFDREYAFLSDHFRRKFGITDRTKWIDTRAITAGDVKIKAIERAKVNGDPVVLPDGRVRLLISLPLGFKARVWMRPIPVLRIRLADGSRPIYALMPAVKVIASEEAVFVQLPDDLDWLPDEMGETPVESFEARVEWFIDDLEMGKGEKGNNG